MSDSDSIAPAWAMHGAMFAHGLVSHARTKKRLKPPSAYSCVDCGKTAEYYDHRDYNKPLDLAPVCASCNGFRGAAVPLTAPIRTSTGLVVSADGIQRIRIESRDFYPKPSRNRDIRIHTVDGVELTPSIRGEFEPRLSE